MKKKLYLILVLASVIFALSACGGTDNSGSETSSTDDTADKTLILADASWDSLRVHNAIATIILEEGYGYDVDVIPGSTSNIEQAHADGDVNIHMEQWPDNYPTYQPFVDEGKIVEVGVNFDDNAQGFYVPKYVIEGDPERGIEALAPDLKSVADLVNYPELFPDDEDPEKGAIINAPPAWEVSQIMQIKYEYYGLGEAYNLINPGSDSALAASLAAAYEKGEPWVGYYWEPTWISGKYDIVLLEEAPYTPEAWANNYECAFKSVECTITMDKASYEAYPDVAEFLSNYKTNSAIIAEFLVYMQENETEIEETAEWFLKNNEDLWKTWVTEDAYNKVIAYLE